ncbi:MAG: ABC transporter permease [Clostridiaceae bacterium]|nr:ABC transporter permease [Clostridiaceae bacterium]
MSSSKEKSSVKQNRVLEVWKQFRRNRGAMIGLVVLIFLILIAVFADVIWDYDTDITAMQVGDRLLKPCLAHPFGTDNYGRDMLARIGYGTRYSLAIGFASVFMGSAVGVPLGALAGYIGGKFDTILMRFIDTFTIIPSLLMTIILVSVLGTNLFNLMLALSISTMPVMTRITRASVMVTRNNDYVESARAIGAPVHVILLQHVLPNCFSPILVQATLRVGTSIISAAGLSYIGLGVPLPTPEWGALLSASKSFIINAQHMCLFPGLAIMITVMVINLVGDGLRDALDPKLKR